MFRDNQNLRVNSSDGKAEGNTERRKGCVSGRMQETMQRERQLLYRSIGESGEIIDDNTVRKGRG